MDDNPVGFLIFFFANLSFSIIIFYFFLREEKGSKVKYKVIKNEEMQEFVFSFLKNYYFRIINDD
ncbi:hypothetical protein PFTANZ_03905 [Plasmodium falciparum Tanzania (2000708)]|uniref:Uncharacterized protein n=1 Tax=Plasmodium falciparum Tanzania (2000708) TaxID=1036725 RepID=A0A024W4F8_PLAFA|nr:hypothetical protein PFTANZ_03905 [Plasmodium falciparum Tanzania (2000708)]